MAGSGKSTLGRLVACLEEGDSGRIELDGVDVTCTRGQALRGLRPTAGAGRVPEPVRLLDPRLSVGGALVEPMLIHGLARGAAARAQAGELLAKVGLDPTAPQHYPHGFSGGQRQRIALALALAAEPRLIVADEPISAVDLSIQAQVIDLLHRLQAELGVAFLFISHDLAVVRRVRHRVAVMRHGRSLEVGPADAVLARPLPSPLRWRSMRCAPLTAPMR